MTAPGTYTGADGREYRWVHEWLDDNSGSGYDHQVFCAEWTQEWIDPADIDAAKAALDALVEAESEEWVEWRVSDLDYRAKPDGSVVEWRGGTGIWTDSKNAVIYRKGREVGQQESSTLRDAARELARTIASHGFIATSRNMVRDFPGDVLVSEDWVRSIRSLAKALEGKL